MSDKENTRNGSPADEATHDEFDRLDRDGGDGEEVEAWVPVGVGLQEAWAFQAALQAIDRSQREIGDAVNDLQARLGEPPEGREGELSEAEEAIVETIVEATGQLDEALERFERDPLGRIMGIVKADREEHQATKSTLEDHSVWMDAELERSRQAVEKEFEQTQRALSRNFRHIHNLTQASLHDFQEDLEDAIDLNFEKLHQRISSLERDVENLQASLGDADDDNA